MEETEVLKDDAKEEKIDYEAIAREKGWKSKKDLGDAYDPARYVGAEEFIKREPLFDTIKQQSKAIKDLKKEISAVVAFTQKNAELAAKKAISELNAQKKEAIKLGDVDSVTEIDKNIEDHQKSIEESKKVVQEVPSEILEWTSQNKWFDTDIELQDFVTSFCATRVKRNPNEPMGDILREAEKATRRAYPEKFPEQKSNREKPSPVETHSVDSHPSGKVAKLGRPLTREEELVCKAYVRDGVMTKDQYIEKLIEMEG